MGPHSLVRNLPCDDGPRFYRRRANRQKVKDKIKDEPNPFLGMMIAALLSLLAFSFATAANLFILFSTETNAIGTAYLRALFLDEPHRSTIVDLMKKYIHDRAEFVTDHDVQKY